MRWWPWRISVEIDRTDLEPVGIAGATWKVPRSVRQAIEVERADTARALAGARAEADDLRIRVASACADLEATRREAERLRGALVDATRAASAAADRADLAAARLAGAQAEADRAKDRARIAEGLVSDAVSVASWRRHGGGEFGVV